MAISMEAICLYPRKAQSQKKARQSRLMRNRYQRSTKEKLGRSKKVPGWRTMKLSSIRTRKKKSMGMGILKRIKPPQTHRSRNSRRILKQTKTRRNSTGRRKNSPRRTRNPRKIIRRANPSTKKRATNPTKRYYLRSKSYLLTA